MKLRIHSLPKSFLAPVTCLLLGDASLHAAQVIYSTGFESPTFAQGQLLGQDGWSTAIPPFLNPGAANVVAGQFVQVRGVDMATAGEVSPFSAVGSYRKPLNYDASGALSIVHLRTDVRLDGPTLGTGDFFTANIAARTGTGFAGELSISSDGFVYGYDGTGDETRLFTAPVTLNAWHTLEIVVNFSANNYTFAVDGLMSGAFPLGLDSEELVRQSLVVYARPDTGTAFRSDYTALFDNVSATAVPEPTGAVLLVFGGLCLMNIRRR